MITHFGDWLKKRIQKLPMEQIEFARAAHIPKQSLKRWLGLPVPNVRPVNLERIAIGLGLPVEQVADALEKARKATEQPVNTPPVHRMGVQRVPIINSIAAGPFAEKTDLDYPGGFADDYIEMAIGDTAAFGLWVDGESMLPRYEPGDLIVYRSIPVDPSKIVEGGDYAVQLDASRDHESTFKRITFSRKFGPAMLIGSPLNPAFKTIEIPLAKVTRLGRVMMIIPRKP